MSDEAWMKQSLSLGERSRITAPPNPWVGCVVVKHNRLVGEGNTGDLGTPHAETIALKQAGEQAQGATVYVTLEPCAHHGRTPPCVDALIQAKVGRVVVAIADPDPRVNGQSLQRLRTAGIEVTLGVCEEAARISLEPYLWQRTTKKPFCVAKSAISIDGRTAAEDGSSQWISTSEAQIDAHMVRARSQAIMIGAGTAIKDMPSLTVRHACQAPRPPLRVILDAIGRVPPQGPLFDISLAPTLVMTALSCPSKNIDSWKSAGAEVEILPMQGELIDLEAVLFSLGERGILQVLAEGGSSMLGNLFLQRLVNRLIVYIGPCILGEQGFPLFRGVPIHTMQDAPLMRLLSVERLGESIRLDYSKR